MQKPRSIDIGLPEALELFAAARAVEAHPTLGPLGVLTLDNLEKEVDNLSKVSLPPEVLDGLMYCYKLSVMHKLSLENRPKRLNYNSFFKKLARKSAQFFKQTSRGEIKLRDFDS